MRYLFFIIFFSHICIGYAQQDLPLELLTKTDEGLLHYFNEVGYDTIKQEKVARAYLNRGKKRKDTIMMARGYDRLARIFGPRKSIVFADSIIELTKNVKNITYPGLAYIIKGLEFRHLNNLPESTKNIYIAYDYAIKNDNVAHELLTLERLITNKSFWGNQQDALQLQFLRQRIIENPNYIERVKKSTRIDYWNEIPDLIIEENLNSLSTFIMCYVNLREYKKACTYLNLMSRKFNEYKGILHNNYFKIIELSKLELNYHQKHMSEVYGFERKYLLTKHEYQFEQDFDALSYVGLAYIRSNKDERGIKYLQKADSIFQNVGVTTLVPYQRNVFESLLNYYKEKNDIKNQIDILYKLNKIDSTFKENYKFFEPNMIKKFETPRLIAEKEKVINGLQKKQSLSKIMLWIGLGLLLIALSVIAYFYRRNSIYKARFKDLVIIENQNTIPEANKNEISQSSILDIGIAEEVVNEILDKLSIFEKKREFLNSDLSLQSLAETFNTNSKYLSKIINLKRQKSFPQYINDLRVNYALKELNRNETFRKYSVKAIAQESGYKNTESFSKAFFKKHGIYPSFYLKQMEENNQIIN